MRECRQKKLKIWCTPSQLGWASLTFSYFSLDLNVVFFLQFPPIKSFPNSLQLEILHLPLSVIIFYALTCASALSCPHPIPGDPQAAGSPLSIKDGIAANTSAYPLPMTRAAQGAPVTKRLTTNLVAHGIHFAVSLRSQRRSLTGCIACGCRFMYTLTSAASLSPADIQALISGTTTLSLSFLSLLSLSSLCSIAQAPCYCVRNNLCLWKNPFCFLLFGWLDNY